MSLFELLSLLILKETRSELVNLRLELRNEFFDSRGSLRRQFGQSEQKFAIPIKPLLVVLTHQAFGLDVGISLFRDHSTQIFVFNQQVELVGKFALVTIDKAGLALLNRIRVDNRRRQRDGSAARALDEFQIGFGTIELVIP